MESWHQPTWPSRVSARTTDCLTDVFKESYRGRNTDPLSLSHQGSKFLPTAIRWCVGTFARLIGSAFASKRIRWEIATSGRNKHWERMSETIRPRGPPPKGAPAMFMCIAVCAMCACHLDIFTEENLILWRNYYHRNKILSEHIKKCQNVLLFAFLVLHSYNQYRN